MRRLVEALERRDHWRQRWRLPCALLVDGRRHRGIVRDVSVGGLFVLTREALPQGADAVVVFGPEEGKRFVLEASVPHQRRISASLASSTYSGVGLRLQNPPAAYLDWVEAVSADES